MPSTTQLEIDLTSRDAKGYRVGLRLRPADSDADNVLPGGWTALDLDALDAASDYGVELTRQFFADGDVKQQFVKVIAAAESADATLRVRLFVAPGAPELHGIRWEQLGDPRKLPDWVPLALDQNVLFSRYLSGDDWRPVRLRARSELKALVVAADPDGLGRYRLAPVDVEGEIGRAVKAMSRQIRPTPLRGPRTLRQIREALRDGYDILYLVCHGSMQYGQAWLWLEGDPIGDCTRGKVFRHRGDRLVAELAALPPARRPLLVVLASCRSSGAGADAVAGDGGVLASLGPKLAAAGIPAVVAMQGDIKMKTVEDFMPAFFAELAHDGQIDRAMAAARREVEDQPDFWAPAVFLRLLGGGLWYEGFRAQGDPKGFVAWEGLLKRIEESRCTPILGPSLLDDMIGPPRKIARQWAELNGFPLSPHGDDELYQVAQFLAGEQGDQAVLDELRRLHFEAARRRYAARLPAALGDADPGQIDAYFDELMEAAAECMRDDESEPHRILARLPFKVYLTINPDNHLFAALTDAGRSPSVAVCPWRQVGSVPDEARGKAGDENRPAASPRHLAGPDPGAGAGFAEPDKDHPLVYHLFGRFAEPDSLVLTEDHYFDFLLGIIRNKDKIPPSARRAMTDNILLFLGFTIDHWTFRALFRSLTRVSPGGRARAYNHIAVQVDPEEGRFRDPERARAYLGDTFRVEKSKVRVYWGRAQDFVLELGERWKGWPPTPGGAAP